MIRFATEADKEYGLKADKEMLVRYRWWFKQFFLTITLIKLDTKMDTNFHLNRKYETVLFSLVVYYWNSYCSIF